MFPFELETLIQLVGYPGIFFIIFAESGLIVAFFLPGASLLFTAGFLASQGLFNIWILVPLVFAAAVLGDNFGYWFGNKVGVKLFERPDSRFFKQAYLERTRAFYAKYGSRTILFARFVPIVRTFAPTLAGIGSMHYPTFLTYNIIGAALWASGITFLGFLLGEAVPRSAEYIELIVLGIIVITLIPLAREWWKHRAAALAIHPPRIVILDLDNTLAESFQPLTAEMAERLAKVTAKMRAVIMTSAGWKRIERDVLPNLAAGTDLANLFLFTDSSGSCRQYVRGAWRETYALGFSREEREHIKKTLNECIEETDVVRDAPLWGPRIIERDASIAFAALGLDAPAHEKREWDPDSSKRRKLLECLSERLPECEVRIGGTTTVDITRRGITKAHGVRWLAKELGIEPKEMLFIGDSLYPGGNDAAVIETGIRTSEVSGPEDTARILDALLRAT